MKAGVAMMVAAVLRLAGRRRPAADVVLALLADEEAGGDLGARVLVDRHARSPRRRPVRDRRVRRLLDGDRGPALLPDPGREFGADAVREVLERYGR
jgi:acetylornithine deacetylase/succinyl-diaminopimelate desuccinylase-like protein